MINSHISGLTHKEILLCAGIASFKSKSRVKQLTAAYRPLLNEEDITLICRLGSLQQLAVALDRSQTQAIGRLKIEVSGGKLLPACCTRRRTLAVEHKEIDTLASDFKKMWGLTPDPFNAGL